MRPYWGLGELKSKMASDWNGFSDEEINFYNTSFKGVRKVANQKKKSTNKSQDSAKNVSQETEETIPENARLCKDIKTENVPLIEQKIKEKEIKKEENENEREREREKEKELVPVSNPVCLKVIEGKAYELVDSRSTDVSKATLEVFEARQKMLEEENKKRKEMLAKVISDRKKQTTEEAKRLQSIQEELQKLDILLSSDVGILRDKIEESSLDFVQAQKRYNKAEKEFLEAKQNLFAKLEKKELLTKLLCTIIEQNELRKAQKLSELMEKLNISETVSTILNPKESALSGSLK